MSVGVFWVTSFIACALVFFGEMAWAGLVAFVGWQLGFAFDCLDGKIARKYQTASAAGAAVDAAADILSMTAVMALLIVAIGESATTDTARGDAALLLAAVGTVARTGGPLWTVWSKSVETPRAVAAPVQQASSKKRLAKWMHANGTDYGLSLALIAAAVALDSATVWLAVSTYLAVIGLGVAALSLFFAILADAWR